MRTIGVIVVSCNADTKYKQSQKQAFAMTISDSQVEYIRSFNEMREEFMFESILERKKRNDQDPFLPEVLCFSRRQDKTYTKEEIEFILHYIYVDMPKILKEKYLYSESEIKNRIHQTEYVYGRAFENMDKSIIYDIKAKVTAENTKEKKHETERKNR